MEEYNNLPDPKPQGQGEEDCNNICPCRVEGDFSITVIYEQTPDPESYLLNGCYTGEYVDEFGNKYKKNNPPDGRNPTTLFLWLGGTTPIILGADCNFCSGIVLPPAYDSGGGDPGLAPNYITPGFYVLTGERFGGDIIRVSCGC